MIRSERRLDHLVNIGWNPPIPTNGWNKTPSNDSCRHWPLQTNTIIENWSNLAVLPAIKTSRDQSVTNDQIIRGQSYTEWNNTREVKSYSQIRKEWLKVKNSKYISESIKDQIHDMYLEETTNHLNQLVFDEPDINIISLSTGTDVSRQSDQGPRLVPKPPAYPRGKSTRRYSRMTRTRVNKSETTALSPVTESPRQG